MSERRTATRGNTEINRSETAGVEPLSSPREDETAKCTYVSVPEQEGILVCDGEVVVDVIYGY